MVSPCTVSNRRFREGAQLVEDDDDWLSPSERPDGLVVVSNVVGEGVLQVGTT